MLLRKPIILFFCLFLSFQVWAQDRPLLDNLAISAGMGYSFYSYIPSGSSEDQGERHRVNNYQISLSKMMQHSWGMRVQYLRNYTSLTDSVDCRLHLAHFDFLWNITNTLLGPTPNRIHNLYGIYGMAVVRRTDSHRGSDNDFSLIVGLRYECQFNHGFYAFADGQALLLPPDFDEHVRLSLLPALSIGLSYRFIDNPYRFYRGDSQHPSYDWFFAISAGLNSLQYRGIGDFQSRMGLSTPAVELSIGKNFSSYWSGRFQWSGLQIRSDYNASAFFNLHADLMLNLSNLIVQSHRAPRFSIYGYGGAGSMMRFDTENSFQFALVGGFYNRLIVGYHSDIFVDIKYSLTPPRFAHVSYNQSAYTVGILTLTAGYVFNLGKNSCRNTQGTIGW